MLGSCSDAPEQLPAEPSSFQYAQRNPFGDTVLAIDTKAYVDALDLLEPKYGKFRRGSRQLPVTVPPEAVRRELSARLEPKGWSPVPELAGWPRYNGTYAFGWRKGRSVYAIFGMQHRSGMAISPVTILTNIPGDKSYVTRFEGQVAGAS